MIQGRVARAFIAAALISKIGNQLLYLAAPLAIYDTTQSLSLTLAAFVASSLPWVASPFLGVLVDSYDRRHVFVVSEVIQGVGLALLATVLLTSVTPLTFVALGIIGCGAVISNIIVGFIFIPALAGENELGRLNALYNASSQIAAVVGLPLGGLIFSVLGAKTALLADAGTFLLTVAMGSLLPLALIPRGTPRKVIAGIREGWHYFRGDSRLIRVAVVLGLSNLGAGSLSILVMQTARGTWGWNPTAVGVAMGVGGVGTALGALLGVRGVGGRGATARALGPWLGLLFAGAALMLACTGRPLMLGGFLLLSVAEGAVTVQSVLLRQLLIPASLAGRVNMLIRMLILGAVPVSGVLQGLLSGFGLTTQMGATALFTAMALLAWMLPARAHRSGSDPDTQQSERYEQKDVQR
jgi:MFS family permease